MDYVKNHECTQIDMFSLLNDEKIINELDKCCVKDNSKIHKKKRKKRDKCFNQQMSLFDSKFEPNTDNNIEKNEQFEQTKEVVNFNGKNKEQKEQHKNKQNVQNIQNGRNKQENKKDTNNSNVINKTNKTNKNQSSNSLYKTSNVSNSNVSNISNSSNSSNISTNSSNQDDSNKNKRPRRKRNKNPKDKSRICAYHFINVNTRTIDMTLTAKQIKATFGISNIKKEIIKDLSTPIFKDEKTGIKYIVIEGEPADESFRTLKEYEDKYYRYSISSYGYVMRITKGSSTLNRKREKLKIEFDETKQKAVSYIQTRQGKKEIVLADVIINYFYNNLPHLYQVDYANDNPMDCSSENLLIIPNKDFAEYMEDKRKRKEKKLKRLQKKKEQNKEQNKKD